ncbi:sigma-70 family RNA polymerase sigma factor [Granulicella mallensis]|uniref:RNA polymerase sigma factor n=1 Tax=Granulicella mallensis TaxID=940614 RepID=A0A7W7ZV91_9BACT|nr:sigma-70 family RNA polymerase sigma factor [Granulicella mallensis]MBB5066745.1 RNA polymerase sigma-70 factor (ECF subfamily) [Granulicella mallensis]
MASQSNKQHSEVFGPQYIDRLYGYAMMLTRNRAEAEDLVQETYLRAFKAIDRLREDSNLKSWLFTILRNVWLNQLRHGRACPPMVDMEGNGSTMDAIPGQARDSYQILAANEDVESVRSAIGSLSTELREIILLREFEELSYREISAVLGCPAGTVMSRLSRARARLRILLGNTSMKQSMPERGTRND